MGFPFEKIDGKEIDLSNKNHRDIVIQRNKELNKVLENGLPISDVNINLTLEAVFNCFKCGTRLSLSYTNHSIDVFTTEIEHQLSGKSITCGCCKTKYKYSYRDEVFYATLEEKTIKLINPPKK
jgi:hypothetical protein